MIQVWSLTLLRNEIPDELPGHISRGWFGKGIAVLPSFPDCTLAMMTSMILSFPDLKELSVKLQGLPCHARTATSNLFRHAAKGTIKPFGATRRYGRNRKSPR